MSLPERTFAVRRTHERTIAQRRRVARSLRHGLFAGRNMLRSPPRQGGPTPRLPSLVGPFCRTHPNIVSNQLVLVECWPHDKGWLAMSARNLSVIRTAHAHPDDNEPPPAAFARLCKSETTYCNHPDPEHAHSPRSPPPREPFPDCQTWQQPATDNRVARILRDARMSD